MLCWLEKKSRIYTYHYFIRQVIKRCNLYPRYTWNILFEYTEQGFHCQAIHDWNERTVCYYYLPHKIDLFQ